MKSNNMKIIIAFMLLVTVASTQAQRLTMPEPSQDASITQRLGISDVTIKYNSPGTLGRKIFGGIIPYNDVCRTHLLFKQRQHGINESLHTCGVNLYTQDIIELINDQSR